MREGYAKLEKQLPKVELFDELAQIKKDLAILRQKVTTAVEKLSDVLQKHHQLQ